MFLRRKKPKNIEKEPKDIAFTPVETSIPQTHTKVTPITPYQSKPNEINQALKQAEDLLLNARLRETFILLKYPQSVPTLCKHLKRSNDAIKYRIRKLQKAGLLEKEKIKGIKEVRLRLSPLGELVMKRLGE